MNSIQNLQEYYARRASEYDMVYEKPERQFEVEQVRRMLMDTFAGHDVLEIACGTGFWTGAIAKTARSVVATDANDAVLDIARDRVGKTANVSIVVADAYDLDTSLGSFTAAVALFWFSHIPKGKRREFLSKLHARIGPGGLVVFVDNNFVEGSNNPMAEHIDEECNTFSSRLLSDGTEWEIVKNFPTEEELRTLTEWQAEDFTYHTLKYYWLFSYRIAATVQAAEHGCITK